MKRLKTWLSSWRNSFPWISVTIIKHIPSKTFRMWLLRIAGAKISTSVSMFASVDVRNPKGLIIEEGCSIGPKVLLDARSGLVLHRNVTVAYDSIIWTLHHDMNSLSFQAIGGPVEIGEYAWICSRSIILPGIKIGKCAVVASGAVVTKDVEDYAIVAGIPARVIGKREELDFNYCPSNSLHIV